MTKKNISLSEVQERADHKKQKRLAVFRGRYALARKLGLPPHLAAEVSQSPEWAIHEIAEQYRAEKPKQ